MADQERFRFTLPETEGASRWDGLSPAARDTVSARASGGSPAGDLLASGESQGANLSPEVAEWAQGELEHALAGWQRYGSRFIAAPNSVEEVAEGHPRYAEVITHLFAAREALGESGEVTPGGKSIGEKTNLVLIPWQEILSNKNRLYGWLEKLRPEQGFRKNIDTIHGRLQDIIREDEPLYRNPAEPELRYSASQYLELAIAMDGLWGIMLAQTSKKAGTKSSTGRSPDDLTSNGNAHYTIDNYDVDAMGVFEWLSLTLQADPGRPSSQGLSWLLANRTESTDGIGVPKAEWSTDEARVILDYSFSEDNSTRPRLAVL